MKKIILTLLSLTLSISYAKCIHEYEISGIDLYKYRANSLTKKLVYVKDHLDTFQPLENFSAISIDKNYTIQLPHRPKASPEGYDDKYIKYYTYDRMQEYIAALHPSLERLNYKVEVVGKSLKGLNLYSIAPKKLDPSKKVILMFGRHHGDEGTANWIIEGFLDKVVSSPKFLNNYQLLLYPMVNPDGATKRSRYNSKGRDLNRSWSQYSDKSKDEVKVIQKNLEEILLSNQNPIIMLDMHGSYTQDFIYQVDSNFKGPDFFETQSDFIKELGSRDMWQASNAQISNGHKKMARILFVRDYSVNALTHETPRDIKKSSQRSLADLKEQGVSIFNTISSLY